ncbi:hypothetical protein EEL32_00275 (plasmid) [Brevibacillus laterosporus]|nr:hypothetical protein [Brevibacillus laterosporus]TPG93527.1 hypothetical protein EEL32_00275 [Brevibacillus laterosporus]
MIKHQMFLHLVLKANEQLTEKLAAKIGEMEESLTCEFIEVHQVVPLDNNEFTVILNCYYKETVH